MQQIKIPVSIDLVKTAQKGLSYDGVIPSRNMKRLNGECAGDCSDVKVSLQTGVDLQGIAYLKGKAVTELTLNCQRCMMPYNTKVTVDFCITPILEKTEIDELPGAYDPIEVDEYGEVRLHQLIEDEIIIEIPIIPTHSESDCNLGSKDVSFGEIAPQTEERPNPFSVLEKLKNK
jgi:uncharacterized protein